MWAGFTRGNREPRRSTKGTAVRKAVFESLEARSMLSATPTLGAIYWDGWFTGNPYQQELSPTTAYDNLDRLPFYATTNPVTVVNDSQSVMDQEIQYAHQGGLSYFAFDWYSPTNSFQGADDYNHGLYDYLSSQYKSELNFSLLLQGGWLGGKANWSTTAQNLADMMVLPTYQKVLGDRPLVYMLDFSGLVSTFGTDAAAAAAMNTLSNAVQTAAKTAGVTVGAPYFVAQVGDASDGVNAVNKDGMDAIGSYAIVPAENGQVAQFPHSELSNADLLYWNQTAATGENVVPTIMTGWDSRPRWAGNVNGDGPGPYFTEATSTDIYNDVTSALNWTSTNQVTDKANTILMYAWNETDEGGWLVPTLVAGAARLSAVDAALTAFPSQAAPKPVSLVNGSFETPQAAPWYVVPSSGMPSSFGWNSAAGPGSYLLANSGAGHFSQAADGQDALLLASAGSLWQDVGTPQANTTYTMSFDLLTGKRAGDKRGSVTAELFAGSTLIGTETVTSPAKSNVWQRYTISVATSTVVTGDLTVEFVNDSGNPWLDNVILSAKNKT